MTTRYQVIVLGHPNATADAVRDRVRTRVGELGLDPAQMLVFLDGASFAGGYDRAAPSVGVYFGGGSHAQADLDALEVLAGDAVTVVPVVDDLARFTSLVPERLRPVNGMRVDGSAERVEALASLLLEWLNLLRAARRLFISYRRWESSPVASQLYETLDERGFDVFLDTHSIRPGEPFQDELWHRLSDTDVVVLLDTKDFLGSQWTREELARASAMSIGILQLVWPGQTRIRGSELAVPRYLEPGDFAGPAQTGDGARLRKDVLSEVAGRVESLRARSLGARQDGMIREFQKAAALAGRRTVLNPERYISLFSGTGKEIAVIPTVGAPDAWRYHQGQELIARFRQNNIEQVYLAYDHRSLRERWLAHLTWLDERLPVKTVRITDVEAWARNL